MIAAARPGLIFVDNSTIKPASARLVGELVMEELKKLDEVAYVRFASVYRRFQDVQEFREEVERLQEAASGNREQMSLLGDEE